MNGFNFPTMFSGNAVEIISDVQAVTTQLALLLNSELYEFRYDPGYGSNVPLLRLRPNSQLTLDLLTDAIYDAQIFCPNVHFSRNQIAITKSQPAQLDVTIDATIDNSIIPMTLQILLEAES